MNLQKKNKDTNISASSTPEKGLEIRVFDAYCCEILERNEDCTRVVLDSEARNPEGNL
jgi:hypothetical protein